MDINILRSIVTGVAFVLFVAIVVWTFWPSHKAGIEDAASIPFLSK
jgi:cytochrome c oxidase cbb3-type subunit IV